MHTPKLMNDAEAYAWLAYNFSHNSNGSFQITSNNKGVSVMIKTENPAYAGYHMVPECRLPFEEYDPQEQPTPDFKCPSFEEMDNMSDEELDALPDISDMRLGYQYHREAYTKIFAHYGATKRGISLMEACNKHIDDMPGNVMLSHQDFDDFRQSCHHIFGDKRFSSYSVEFKGTIEEFRKLPLSDSE